MRRKRITPGALHPRAYESTTVGLWIGRWRAAWLWGYRPERCSRTWLWRRG
jgi:hypothetical protein